MIRRAGRIVADMKRFAIVVAVGLAVFLLWRVVPRGDDPADDVAVPADSQHGDTTMPLNSLQDLYLEQLKDLYSAETQISKNLPAMIGAAKHPELKAGFEKHLQETKGHVERVEQVFEMHGVKAKAVNCPAIDGILEEAEEIAGDIADDQVLDAALIAAAQAVEHYEITRYGTLVEWAKKLGRSDCAAVLEKNLKEEMATDKKLTGLAERKINLMAAE